MKEAGLPPLVGTVIITFRWGNLFSQYDSVILGASCSSDWMVMVSERRTTWRFCVCPVHFVQLGCSPLPHRGVAFSGRGEGAPSGSQNPLKSMVMYQLARHFPGLERKKPSDVWYWWKYLEKWFQKCLMQLKDKHTHTPHPHTHFGFYCLHPKGSNWNKIKTQIRNKKRDAGR